MNTKKCTVEPTPEPSPPDPCKIQRIQQKIKAGIKICPKPPVEPPPPPPVCHALCIERIKNPPVKITDQRIVCVVERQRTGTERCDAILDLSAAHPDLPWPGCPPPVIVPPPPGPTPCEIQEKKISLAECKERMRRYRE